MWITLTASAWLNDPSNGGLAAVVYHTINNAGYARREEIGSELGKRADFIILDATS